MTVRQDGAQGQPSQAKRWLQALAGLAVVAGSLLVAWTLISTKPSSRRQPKAREATLVEVVEVASVRRSVTVDASGTVVAAHTVEVRPEVSGRVRKIGTGLVPGTLVEEGDLVAQLDPRDFSIAVARARSTLARAQSALAIERGSQRIARREMDQYEKDHPERKPGDKALALRKPQLDAAQADIADAKAALAQAQLDASRTRITAPFDAVLRQRAASVGMYVTPSTVLATLVGTSTWWVEVAVPKDQLRWLQREGAKVRVYDEAAWGPDVFREGRVLRIGAEVVEGGRMVKVVVAVDDPLDAKGTGAPKMLLGSWARVQIEGAEVEAVELERNLLHDGDTVWVMTAENVLDVRTVVVGARGRDSIFVVEGLTGGDKVVSSALQPVPGMGLRTQEQGASEARR